MRMNRPLSAFAAALFPALSWGHHSFAMFDAGKTVTLNGTLKEIQWVSPHSWIQLLIKDDSGKDVEWSIECGGPQQLYRDGWRRSATKVGDTLTLYVHPLRDGRAGGSLISARLADGTQLGGRAAGPQTPLGPASSG